MRKRILSIALTLCMLFPVLPQPVFAEGEESSTTTAKDITLGYSALHEADTENAKWDYVYFGKYSGNPIKWRVLSTKGNNTTVGTSEDTATYKTASGDTYTGNALFMLSENILTVTRFDEGLNNNNEYSTSTLRDKMQKNIFAADSNELKYVLKTTKTDSAESVGFLDTADSPYSISYGESQLSDDILFALSAREVEQYLGTKCANHISRDLNGDADYWWLRSPYAGYSLISGIVNNVGYVDAFSIVGEEGVRPALNLNLSSVLFTSAAVGGKSSNAAAGVVTENSNLADITGNDGYKLTLLDESRSGFSAYLKSFSGNTATVSYSGATTGTNEYISVIIKNGDDVKYYGRVLATYAASAASGTVDITLPSDFSTAKGDVLCVFNEQYNGDKMTDYASELVVLPDYRWYTNNTSATEFTISTASELLGFANLVNGTNLPDGVSGNVDFSGRTVKLLNDIDLSCISNWTPIGKNDGGIFLGTFDGQGKTISNLTVISDEGYGYVGLFGRAMDAAIQNIAVSGNVTATRKNSKVGGIVGHLNNSKIENCSFSGNITALGKQNFVGGIVGECVADDPKIGVISKCRNTATISGASNYDRIGGIVGDTNGNILYCYNQGNITLSVDNAVVGGIAGFSFPVYTPNGGKTMVVQSCYSTGTISFTGTIAKASGIFGCVNVDACDINLNGIYYLDSTATMGIGEIYFTSSGRGEMKGSAEGKSLTAFENGEVAWLLQNAADGADGQIWGQAIGTDDYPVFATADGSNTVYKVTFKVDGKDDQARYVNKGGTVSIDAPTAPTGYHFDGWYTEQTGGTEFDFTTAITADTTLYARFALNTYTVSYSAGQYGSGSATTDTKTHGEPLTLRNEIFTRTGYTQTGWATADEGETVYAPGDSYTDNAAVTLYPAWSVNEYTITVKPENGDKDIAITQDYDTTVTEPTLTKDGYDFIGWDKAFSTNMPAEDVTITAQWKDITAPTGEIKIGTNSFKTFLNNITFGLFFKDTQEVEITATDNSGEDVTIEYLLSDKELSETELATATFTAYSGKFNIEPNSEYVIYAKLTDKAGNVTYINSDGIVLDNVVPVISGIKNGKTYCLAQTVTVTEKYVDTVTVNGASATLDENGQFTVAATEDEQKIVVTDKAGNQTEITVTVNDGHTYEWQNENGQYWQKCKYCDHETEKSDIPQFEINGNDTVCEGHDWEFTFTLPEGSTDVVYGYDFEMKGTGDLTPTYENGVYTIIIPADDIENESSFKLNVYAKTSDGFDFTSTKEVTIISYHTDGDDNHICDICEKTISDCGDNDNDHKCDICGKTLSDCVDNDNDHKCDICGKTLYELGDVNKDGKVNIRDATLIQKYLAKLADLDEEALSLADFDQNGKVNVKDATAIQKFLAGIKPYR